MCQSVRTVIVGLGTHGRSLTRLVAASGAEVIAGVDPFHAGKDLGELTDTITLAGITVVADVQEIDWEGDPADLVIVTVKQYYRDVAALIEQLVTHADVVTLVEDLYDLQNFDSQLYHRLDAAAKDADHTIYATGAQDVGWAGIVLAATGMVRDLREVQLRLHLGVDGYPEDFLRWVGIGVTHQEWQEAADEAAKTPSVLGAVLPVIARGLGLTAISQSRDLRVVTRDSPLASVTYGRDLAPGEPIGRYDLVTLETKEEITLSAALTTSGVPGEDVFTLVLEAEPRIELNYEAIPGNGIVDATLVNRIPDVLAAPSGFVNSEDLSPARYRRNI